MTSDRRARGGGTGPSGWRVWADTGGTFTDCVGIDPSGRVHRAKVLSSGALRGVVVERLDARRLRVRSDWQVRASLLCGAEFRALGARHDPLELIGVDAEGVLVVDGDLPPLRPGERFELRAGEPAPVLGARLLTGTPLGSVFPPVWMRLATTRGTNALLERRGVPPVLFVTRGFRDVLRIGTQQRPELFALEIRRPAPLATEVVEVGGRLASDGTELEPLALDEAVEAAAARFAEGARSAAIALLHAHREPGHERRLADALRDVGFTHVSRSSRLAPFIGLLPRAETAVVDAYLGPVVGAYLEAVASALGGAVGSGPCAASAPPAPVGSASSLLVMTSAGGLVRAERYAAKDSLLSGPAGGVVGAAHAARLAGAPRSIAFDMGGTSTDVARIDGDYDYRWEHTVGDAHLLAPALAIETVAAGGGSVCSLDDDGLRVGPESAGAEPGPACYGAGGPLTVTDANLLLGRFDARRFGVPLDTDAARARAEELRRGVTGRGGAPVDLEPLLAGLIEIADERMADAIRRISLRRGYDPADHALVAFGGAGPQHACGVAERLGIRRVIVPVDAGLLSALGLGEAVVERIVDRQVLDSLDAVADRIAAWFDALGAEACTAVTAEGVAGVVEVRRRILRLRYRGQESTLPIEWSGDAAVAERFERHYREVYGHTPERRAIEVESLRVIASTASPPTPVRPVPAPRDAAPVWSAHGWWPRAAAGSGGWVEVPVFERVSLDPGARLRGPALVVEAHSTTVVAPGWTARVDGSGALMMEAGQPSAIGGARVDGATVAAVREELFVHRFEALVGEMGEQLRRTALSVNVRERLDFSCALLDARGELVANAPHIPVHLGALGLCVREVARALPLAPGDVAVTNHPGYGGSHLPDITVIAPVHAGDGRLVGYVANRAHHAELGGTRPGSMPPAARCLAEEGVVLPPTVLVRDGAADWARLEARLTGGDHPSRAVADNLADLRAQVAAAYHGVSALRRLVEVEGAETVAGFMDALTSRAERRAREALLRLGDARFQATERLDDGTPLAVRIRVGGGRAVFDFAGSGAVHTGNLNATPAIVRSVALYVLRLMIGEPLPLNEGLLRVVELRVPRGILNPPFDGDADRAPAVVGGNVETSQRLVDTLLRALGLAACSQGTMNNVLFGSDRFGYYETVCGGAGAGPGWAGASAVHTHMTNTRITDPEVLEHRYPVRVERFAVRRGSGGAGRWPGGDGVVRELRFLEPVSLSVLGQHRVERPYGGAGGMPGQPGRQYVVRADDRRVELGPVDGCEMRAGDRFVLETPGGGGWGEPSG